jgi:hypothetical protein
LKSGCSAVLAAALRQARAIGRRIRACGAVGVVVDRHGALLGTYLDPYTPSTRPPRLHRAGSPWTPGGGHAWEGFGPTQQEALANANRLRRRHLRLLHVLVDDDPDRLRFPTAFGS